MSNALTTHQTAVVATDAAAYLTDPAKFEHIWRVAKCFAMSSLTPDTLRGKPEDCFILTQLAMRLKCDPFMLMQNTYVVHGRPGMEAKLQIGLLNSSGRIRGNVAYTFSGKADDYGCEASAIDAATGSKITGPKVTWKMVKAEGWDQPKGKQPSKWRTMPELMFRYRAAAMLIRTHYPEVTLGLLTREELEDQIIDVESTLAEPVAPGKSKADALAERLLGRHEKAAEPTPEPEPTTEPEPQEEAVEASGDDEPQSWFDQAVRRLRLCKTVLELRPLVMEITDAEECQALPQELAEQLAGVVTEMESRLE